MTPEERADAIAHAVMRSVIIEGRKLTFEDIAMRIDALSHLRAAIAEEREECAKIAANAGCSWDCNGGGIFKTESSHAKECGHHVAYMIRGRQ